MFTLLSRINAAEICPAVNEGLFTQRPVNNHKCTALGHMFGRAESKRLGPGGLTAERPGHIAKQEKVVYSIQEVI